MRNPAHPLLQNNNFILLAIGQTISAAGDWMLVVVLQVLVYRVTHTAAGVAWLMAFELVPMLLVAPVAGVLIDRWDRKTTVVVSLSVKALLVAVFSLLSFARQAPAMLYGLTALVAVAARFSQPAGNTLLPAIVVPELLSLGNSVVMAARVIGMGLGPVLAGIVLAAYGTTAALAAIVLSFALGGGTHALLSLRKVSAPPTHTPRSGMRAELREGLSTMHGVVGQIILVAMVVALVMGSLEIVAIVFVARDLLLPEQSVGFLLGGYGVGMLFGLLIASFLRSNNTRAGIAIGLLTMALSLASSAVATSLVTAVTAISLAGLGEGLVLALAMLVLYEQVNLSHQGRVFAIQDSAMSAAFLVAIFVSGIATDSVGARATLGANAVVLLIASLWFTLVFRFKAKPT